MRKEVLPPGELESKVQVRHDSCTEAVDKVLMKRLTAPPGS